MGKPSQFSPEARERAVQLVLEHQAEHESQWAAIGSIAAKLGLSLAKTPSALLLNELRPG